MRLIFKKKIIITLLVIIFITVSLLFLAIFITPQYFLAINQPVNANLLVVEGWLPPYAIELTNKEYHKHNYDYIITTGLVFPESEDCMLSENGYLIFYPHFKSILKNDNKHHTIEVLAHSKMNGKYCAHFNFFVNDSLIADFSADKKKRKYGITWNGPLADIDSVMIQFDNDYYDDRGDRNLYVKEIIIDNSLRIPFQFNSEYDIGSLDKKERIINNFNSFAELARTRLIATGIDSTYIIAVPGKRTHLNRTLNSAVAFRDWLKATDKRVTAINIISRGIHSRRTLMAYKKVLGKTYDIGIISLPEEEKSVSKRPGVFETLYEIVGLIYYRIILIPY